MRIFISLLPCSPLEKYLGPVLWSVVKLMLALLASNVGVTLSLCCSTSSCSLVMCPWRQWNLAWVLGPLHPCRTPKRNSWLWLATHPGPRVLWRTNKQIKDLCLCLYVNSAFQISKPIFYLKMVLKENICIRRGNLTYLCLTIGSVSLHKNGHSQ